MKTVSMKLKDEDYAVLSRLAAASCLSMERYVYRCVCVIAENDMECSMKVLQDTIHESTLQEVGR